MATRIRLANDRTGFARLRAVAERFATGEGFSESMGHRLVLILEELFTNVHKYAKGSRPAETINVELDRVGDDLVIAFADDGAAFNPLNLPKPRIDKTLGERPIGGLGVYIVRSMASESHYERKDGWNRLRLVCAIRP